MKNCICIHENFFNIHGDVSNNLIISFWSSDISLSTFQTFHFNHSMYCIIIKLRYESWNQFDCILLHCIFGAATILSRFETSLWLGWPCSNVYNGMTPSFRVTLSLVWIVHSCGCYFVFIHKRCKLRTHSCVCLYEWKCESRLLMAHIEGNDRYHSARCRLVRRAELRRISEWPTAQRAIFFAEEQHAVPRHNVRQGHRGTGHVYFVLICFM